MSKSNKTQAPSQKYVEVLERFGLLPKFDFTKKEKKIVKYLKECGSSDLIAMADALDMKPAKVKKILARLVDKGAVEVILEEVRLTSLALRYVHAKKEERKSAKKFYKFVDALSEKELDDFMSLVSSFKISPVDQGQEEEKGMEETVDLLALAAMDMIEEAAKEEKKETAPRKPRATRPRTRKPASRQAKPKQEEPKAEEPKAEEKPE